MIFDKPISKRTSEYSGVRTTLETDRDNYGYTHFRRQERGGDTNYDITMQVRRVDRGPWSREDYASDQKVFDEVQISMIYNITHPSGRTNGVSASLGLRGEEIDLLIAALQQAKEVADA